MGVGVILVIAFVRLGHVGQRCVASRMVAFLVVAPTRYAAEARDAKQKRKIQADSQHDSLPLSASSGGRNGIDDTKRETRRRTEREE